MRQLIKRMTCFVLALLLFLLSGCSNLFSSPEERALAQSRPENGAMRPNFDGEVTDVRITVVPRAYTVPSNWASSELYEGMKFLHIYYGYEKDGRWYDMPCENYDLVSIFNSRDYYTEEFIVQRGYDASGLSHIVKIGPYLLISIPVNAPRESVDEWEVSDSLGSEFTLMFSEYHTTSVDTTEEYCYGYFKEKFDWNDLNAAPKAEVSNSFYAHYYLVLDYESIPEDYVLKVRKSADEKARTLTYDDIHYLLGDKESNNA